MDREDKMRSGTLFIVICDPYCSVHTSFFEAKKDMIFRFNMFNSLITDGFSFTIFSKFNLLKGLLTFFEKEIS